MEARELDYDLPPELIAQRPAERRDGSRLLVYSRAVSDDELVTLEDYLQRQWSCCQ